MSAVSRRDLFLAPLAAVAACKPKRSSGFAGHAFVAIEAGRAVVAVDLTGFAVTARIDVGGPPAALAAHPSRGTVYALLPAAVAEIQAKTFSVARRATLPGEPAAFQLDPAGETLWILLRRPAALLPIPLQSMKPGKLMPLPAEPVAFDLSLKKRLAAVSLADGAVVFADLAAATVSASVPLSSALGPVVFRADGQYLLVADKAQRRLSVLDSALRRPVVHLPLSLRPDRFCMKSDGGQLFLTGEGRDAVVVAYPYRTEIAQTALSGRAPGAMAASESPEYLFVANPSAASVTIFDIATQRVLAVTQVGAEPSSVVVTPDQQYALVLNRGSGDMAVIRIRALATGRSKSAALFTMIPVGSRPTGAVLLPS